MSQVYSEPRYADYVKAIWAAQNVLAETGIATFPVSLRIILRHYKIRMMSYTDFCAANDLAMEECLSRFGKDGATISGKDGFLIVYNKEISPPERRQFTMAHELGHIILQHHKILGTNIIQRMWVEKPLYEVLEDEANCFARNLLSPPVASMELLHANGFTENKYDEAQKRLVWVRPVPVKDYMEAHTFLQRAFMITPTAAKTRCHFLRDDLINLRPQQKKNPPQITFSAKWRCPTCGAERVDGKQYCYNCGRKPHFKFEVKNDAPAPLIDFPYEGSHFKSCFFCGNISITNDAFCTVCGKPTSNPCIPYFPRKTGTHRCPPNARFCCDCGNKTLYAQKGYKINDEGAAEMNYGPTIPHDEFSKRISTCPKCLYDKHAEDAMFCIMCGTSLYNSCPDGHPNSPNARFCAYCGLETDFLRQGILTPVAEILEENQEEVKTNAKNLGFDVDEFLRRLKS